MLSADLHRIARRAGAGAVVAALTICALAAAFTAPTAAATGDRLTDSSLLVGGYFAPKSGDYTKLGQQNEILTSEAAFGRRYDLVQSYYPFSTPFPTWRESWNISQGRTPVIAWNGITDAASVAAGAYDTMIHTRAHDVAALGAPVVIRFAWEMDGASNPVKPASAADYVAQWRRIHDIFAAEGATNVIWMWCPNAWGFDNGQAPAYYPGDAYVSWIGADGYDFAPIKANTRHQSFESIFSNSYDWAKAHGKPFTIGEFGALEDPAIPGYKAAWLDAGRQALAGRLAGTKAVLAWSHADYSYDDKTAIYDFRLDTSDGVAAAWTRWNGATNSAPAPTVTTVTSPATTATTIATDAAAAGTKVIRPRADRHTTARPARSAIRRLAL